MAVAYGWMSSQHVARLHQRIGLAICDMTVTAFVISYSH